jgi:signal peptidase I
MGTNTNMGTDEPKGRPGGWLRRIIIGRKPTRTLMRIGIWIALCLAIRQWALLPVRVDGPSMLPTYKDGRVNFVNRLAFLFHEPRRGDIVAIRYSGDHAMLLKRVVGLPGERVGFHAGHVVINGVELEEPYVKLRGNWEREAEQVGMNEYYVVGDNREMEWGMHEKGKAVRNRILGKILL